MADNVIGSALIKIMPDMSGFGTTVNREVSAAAGKAADSSKKGFSKGGDDAAKGFGKSFRKTLGGMTLFDAAKIATAFGALRGVVGVLKDSVAAQRDAIAVGDVTEAMLKSTGAAAWTSGEQISEYANKLQLTTGVSDEMIQSGQNVLLSFTQIQNAAGKGNEVFDRATKAALDMSTVMGGSGLGGGIENAKAASLALGKALNDPIKGLSKLSRSGVVFTDEQKKMVEQLQSSGDLLGAQKIILEEVEKEFGGAAAAAADPMKVLAAVGDNLRESLGAGLLGAIEPLAEAMVALVPVIEPVVTMLGTTLGGVISALAPMLEGLVPAIGIIVEALTPVITAVGEVFGQIGPIVADVFAELGPEITAFGEAFGNIVKVMAPVLDAIISILAPVIGAVLTAITPVLNVISLMIPSIVEAFMPLIDVIGPALRELGVVFGEVFSGVLVAILPVITTLITTLVDAITPLIPIFVNVASIIANTLAAALEVLAPVLGTIIEAFGTILAAVLPPLAAAWESIYEALEPLIPVFVELVALLGSAFADVLTSLAPIIAEVAATFGDVLADVLPIVADALLAVMDAIKPLLTPENIKGLMLLVSPFMFLLEVLGPLMPTIGKVVTALVTVASTVLKALLPALPPLIEAVMAVVDAIGPILGDVLEALIPILPPLGEAFGAIAIAIADLLVALLPLLTPLLKFAVLLIDKIGVTTIVLLANALVKIVEVVAGLVTWIAQLVSAFATLDFGAILETIGGFFSELPGNVMTWLGDLGQMVWDWLQAAFQFVIDSGPDLLLGFGEWLGGLPAQIIGWLGDFGTQLATWFVDAFMWFATNAVELLAEFVVWWVTLPITLINLLGNFGLKIAEWLVAAFFWIQENGPQIIEGIKTWFASLPDKFFAAIKSLVNFASKIKEWIKGAFDGIKDAGGDVLAGVTEWLKGLPDKFIGFVKAGGDLASKVWDWLKHGIDVIVRRGPELLTSLSDFFTGIPGKIGEWLSGALGDAAGAALDIAGDIWTGIKDFINTKVLDPIREKKISIGPYDAHPFSFLPELAEGGIFTSPTPALIGEAGAEVVIPLTDAARARELVQKSGLMDLLGEKPGLMPVGIGAVALPGAPAAPAEGGALPVGAAVEDAGAADVTGWFASLAEQAITALLAFGETVWKAVAPSFMFLTTSILTLFTTTMTAVWALFTNLTILMAAWPMATWTAMQPGFASFTTSATLAFDTMASTIENRLRSMFLTLAADSTTGGSSVVVALSEALTAGTTAVETIVKGYGRELVDALNPILTAVGKPTISLSNYAEGGVNNPRIVPDGSYQMHVFGEKGTGGEAYIPFAPGLRARSRALTEETARRLGGVAYFAQGGVTGDTKGLHPEFLNRLSMWSSAVGQNYNVGSGYRSIAEQAAMYADFLAGIKKEETAPPGRSFHNYGLASDGNHWRNLNPGAFGLEFPMGHEPWHVQPFEAAQWRSMMPDEGWAGMKPLPEVPNAGSYGALSTVAAAVMETMKSSAVAVSETMGAIGGVDIAGLDVNLNRILATIRTLESGGNYTAQNAYSTASGAYQFLNSTWGGYGGYGRAADAPASVQDARAAQDVKRFLEMYDGQLEAVPGNWYNPAIFASGNWNQRPGGGGNPLTVQGYINKWLGTYASLPGYAMGGVFDSPTTAVIGEDGREVLIPLTRPERALELALQSGLFATLAQAVSSRTAGTAGSTLPAEGPLPGTGNTYNIFGPGAAAIAAEIRARDEAMRRVRQ